VIHEQYRQITQGWGEYVVYFMSNASRQFSKKRYPCGMCQVLLREF
jgi:hypothetical protein